MVRSILLSGLVIMITYAVAKADSTIIRPDRGDYMRSGVLTPVPNNTGIYKNLSETALDLSAYVSHGTTAGYLQLLFIQPSLPNGTVNMALSVSCTRKDGTSGTNKLGMQIMVGGTRYNGTSVESPTSWGGMDYLWTLNPKTGAAWTISQFTNSSDSNSLNAVGFFSSDANPVIQVAQLYGTILYDIATATRTNTPTDTVTPTFTHTSTATPTGTATLTYTHTPVQADTATFTPTPTFTDTATKTSTYTFTVTATYTATITSTPTFTSTPTNSVTFSATPTATATKTHTPTNTNTATSTMTITATPTITITNYPSPTHTPIPQNTETIPVIKRIKTWSNTVPW